MFCRNCGHQNPEQNGFCGMCGNALAVEAPRDLATAVDPVDTPHEPPQPEPAAPVAEPAPRSDKWWVDEEPSATTSGVPSFLGLSSTDSGEGGNYSYLLEEEQTSHTGVWVLLVVLLVLGGVLYAKWQPIRDYVLTTALSHSRPQPQPAQDTKNEPPSTSATSAPATTLAGSDAASQPAITTESTPEQNQAAQPKEDLPHADPQSSTAGKPDDSPKPTPARASSERAAEPASKPPGAKSPAAKNKTAGHESANPAGEEKPAAAQMAPPPQGNAGGELVSSGERYLYARGVARNCGQAVSYFNAAAAQQNPQAFSHLGAMYATGECVPMDRAVAYAWFRRAYAQEPGNRYFEQNLIMLWRDMTPAERQRATGRQ
ncbi:MAG: hypothetical protein WCC59_19210 [Terriglobales bacterium]